MKMTIIATTLGTIFCIIHVSLAGAIEYGLDAGGAYYNWKEHVACKVEEAGPIGTVGGYLASFPLVGIPALNLRSDVEFFTGRVDFDTASQSCTIAVRTKTDYWGYKLEGSVGWRMNFSRFYVEPFLGLAYRAWKRDIESDVFLGYPELYRIFYGRIGFRSSFPISSGIIFISTLSLDPISTAREEIDWPVPADSNSPAFRETLNLRNGRRLGWMVEGGIQWSSLKVTGYWQATRLGRSKSAPCTAIIGNQQTLATCSQPKSFQDIIGFKLGYRF